MLLVPAAALNLADAWSLVAPRAVRWATEVTLIVLAVLAYSVIFDPARLLNKYSALSPLNLHGATRIRLGAPQVRVYQDLLKAIDDSCETFATVPNFMSLHFWTRKAPPGGFKHRSLDHPS